MTRVILPQNNLCNTIQTSAFLHRANTDRLKIAIAEAMIAQDIDRARKLKILLQIALKLVAKYTASPGKTAAKQQQNSSKKLRQNYGKTAVKLTHDFSVVEGVTAV